MSLILFYSIIIVKTTNINQLGYKSGDLINIRLFDPKNSNPKDIDDYFNLKMYQPLYSSMHNYNNIHIQIYLTLHHDLHRIQIQYYHNNHYY